MFPSVSPHLYTQIKIVSSSSFLTPNPNMRPIFDEPYVIVVLTYEFLVEVARIIVPAVEYRSLQVENI